MSTPPTGASGASNASTAPVARQGGNACTHGPGQKPGASGPAALFANLLHLMGSSDAAPEGSGDLESPLPGLDLGALASGAQTIEADTTEPSGAADTSAAHALDAIWAWTTPANPWAASASAARATAHPATDTPVPAGASDTTAPALSADGTAEPASPSGAPAAQATSPAPTQPAAGSQTALPPGWVALSNPVPADGRLAAAAEQARAAHRAEGAPSPAGGTPPERSGEANTPGWTAQPAHTNASGARPAASAQWRSTATLGHTSGQRPSAARPSTLDLAQQAQGQARLDPTSLGARATVLTPDNVALAVPQEEADTIGGSATSGSLPGGGAGGQAPGGGGATGFAATSGAASAERGRVAPDDSASAQAADPEAAEDPAAYAPQTLRQVNVRVGDTGEGAIDIRLALEGESLSVDFRTDSAETRNQLQQSAASALSDMLQRGGLQLGGVSVGAQSQGQGQHQATSDGAPARGAATTSTSGDQGSAPEDANAQSGLLRPRSDGTRPLDLFV